MIFPTLINYLYSPQKSRTAPLSGSFPIFSAMMLRLETAKRKKTAAAPSFRAPAAVFPTILQRLYCTVTILIQ